MTSFQFQEHLGALKDKIVILTGGANGIGAATVRFLAEKGAYICSADQDAVGGQAVVDQVVSKYPASGKPRACFKQTDVTSYESLLALFDFCMQTYGRIDSAVSCAGIIEVGNWFNPELTLETVRQVPPKKTLDVNLLGSLYFSRIAVVYLKQGSKPSDDKSLTLISSLAGFKDTPGMPLYQASKHGILGLLRCLRPVLPESNGVRVNAVCPWYVATGMTSLIEDKWLEAGLPVNQPGDIAQIIAGLTAIAGLNGKAIYAEGGRGWEIEDNLNRLQPQWLGEEPSASLEEGQKALMEWSGLMKNL
ncbi:hypothetical protein PV10_04288 [Exophiala mesophila]|uniref:3-hydroxyacyl-CoA dehydrogenase n=1 Tax=Exophiala mesophila TaxID=212818 RepID=A0A0D2A1Z9_EXOME|nr:uncharacterized protein PV10_04288 [Exophiala mesophila]KIV93043.1 hypothetical protein PV10_04288 [Exophiala mesophila]